VGRELFSGERWPNHGDNDLVDAFHCHDGCPTVAGGVRAGGVVQGLAIASMHYTAMAATYFVPLDAPADPLFTQNWLALMIAGAILVVCTSNLTLLGFMSLQQKKLAQLE
jgi:NO-binding membrane sensor protein with MHYT domain